MHSIKQRLSIFFSIGFRPMYLLGSVYALLSVPLWLAGWTGLLDFETIFPSLRHWHIHEMLWGFLAAIISGFLLTAVRTWTGRMTPSGYSLAFIAVLWLAGRITVLTGPPILAALIDCLFLPVVALAIARPVITARNSSNYFAFLLPCLMALANMAYHAMNIFSIEYLDIIGRIMLFLALLVVAIVGGRVIPFFIGRAIPCSRPKRQRGIELLCLGSLLLLPLQEIWSLFVDIPEYLRGIILLVPAVLHLHRLFLWDVARTIHHPLLWILVVSYAWLPLALFFWSLSAFGLNISDTYPVHMLTLGLFSGLILGMMTRTTRGHTGRALTAGGAEVFIYCTIILAVIFRVLLQIISPGYTIALTVISGILWFTAFAAFLIIYGPWLLLPRADGQPD